MMEDMVDMEELEKTVRDQDILKTVAVVATTVDFGIMVVDLDTMEDPVSMVDLDTMEALDTRVDLDIMEDLVSMVTAPCSRSRRALLSPSYKGG